MLTIKEASDYLGISTSTLRHWDKVGKITSYRTEGNHRGYDKNELVKFKEVEQISGKTTISYCRESSSDQKEDLERQIQ